MLKKKAKSTSKASTKKKGGGVSLDDDDAIEAGLFSSGPAVIKESIFAMFDYGGNAKPVPVWLLTFGRDGEEDYEQPYSLGKGWKISDDGKELIAKAGQTGLPKSCNAIRHLIKPLKAALANADDIEIDLTSGDPSVLDGLEVVLRRVDQEVRDIRDKSGKKKRDDREDKGPRTILEIEEVTGTEGDTSASTVKKKKKAKPVDDEDDEDQDDDTDSDEDDDEDEKPKSKAKGKKKPAADEDEDEDEDSDDDEESDDDDEDEKPAKKKGKLAAKAKGKSKASDDDEDEDADEDEESDDDPREEAIEALIEVVSDGDVPLSKLEARLAKLLKGNKQAEAIIEWATSTKNLKLEKGWSFNGKVVSAEE